MQRLKVSEYARRAGVSVNAVYKRIQKGILRSEKQDGLTYVLIDEEKVTTGKNIDSSECEELLKLIKWQAKEIKRLSKQLEKSNRRTEKALRDYLGEYQKAIPSKPASKGDEIVVKPKKKGKKKDKKRRK